MNIFSLQLLLLPQTYALHLPLQYLISTKSKSIGNMLYIVCIYKDAQMQL